MNKLHLKITLMLLCFASCTPFTDNDAAKEGKVDEATATQVMPFLMFQEGNAETAMNFYVSLFEDGRVVLIDLFEAGNGPKDTVQQGIFEIAGQRVRCMDSPIKHAWSFTPGVSLFVDCTSAEQIERLVEALKEGGKVMMPMGDYGFSKKFAFVEDRFGISWQLNLPE